MAQKHLPDKTLRRRIFCPQWRYEALEAELARMERDGYRLDYVGFFGAFRFRQTRPREVRYIITYNFDRGSGMLHCEGDLKHQHRADPVPTGNFCWANFYRITNLDSDLGEILRFRRRYLRRVLWEKAFLGGFYVAIFGILLASISNLSSGFVVTAILLVLALWYVVRQIYGILTLRKGHHD